MAMHAGASASSEVSADDYAGLIGRLHSMRVSFMGEPSAGSPETNATSSGTPNTGAPLPKMAIILTLFPVNPHPKP